MRNTQEVEDGWSGEGRSGPAARMETRNAAEKANHV